MFYYSTIYFVSILGKIHGILGITMVLMTLVIFLKRELIIQWSFRKIIFIFSEVEEKTKSS